MSEVHCTSCKNTVANESATRFNCPNCSETELIRCSNCRANAAKYTCASCEFTGPN